MPTDRLTADGVHAAYWVDAGERAPAPKPHLPEPCHSRVGPISKYIGC
jgi:hypothetical protein